MSVIYKSKLLTFKTSQALFLAISYQPIYFNEIINFPYSFLKFFIQTLD